MRRSGCTAACRFSVLPKLSKYTLNIKHILIYNGHRDQPLTELIHPWVESSLLCQPNYSPLCTVIVFPALMSICQKWANAGSLAGTSHLATLVPSAGDNSSTGGSQIWLLLEHKAGVSGWLSAGHRLFLKSVNFQGGEPCFKKPGDHLRISVHIREKQYFDFFFFLSCDFGSWSYLQEENVAREKQARG